MSLSGSKDTQEEARPVRENQIFGVGRNHSVEDGVVRRIGREAQFPSRGFPIEMTRGNPADAVANEEDRQNGECNAPTVARRMPGKAFLLGIEAVGGHVHGSNEAVTATSKSFDEDGILGRVAEGISEAFHGSVEAVIEVDEGIGGPEPGSEFLAGNDLAGPLQEHGQERKGLFLKLDFVAILAELGGAQIGLEQAETNDGVRGEPLHCRLCNLGALSSPGLVLCNNAGSLANVSSSASRL